MPKKIDFIIAKVGAFHRTLEKLDSKAKAGHVPIQLAENFNKLLVEIAKESPDAAAELPQSIGLKSNFAMLGTTDISYATLDIMVDQVLGVLEVLKAGN